MRIQDFLHKTLHTQTPPLVIHESDLRQHLAAYLRQIWPEGKLCILTDARHRDEVEQHLQPALETLGGQTQCVVCAPSAGVPYRTQIAEKIGNTTDHPKGVVVFGDADLFEAARQFAAESESGCCAVFGEFCPEGVWDAFGSRPCIDAVFFDLDEIADSCRGDFRAAVQELECAVCALRLDALCADMRHPPVPHALIDAIDEAMPPRLPRYDRLSEDELAQISEAWAWKSIASRLTGHNSSLHTVIEYADESREFTAFPASAHAAALAAILDYALDRDELEIDPDDCANHRPPEAIHNRTLQQILIEDGLSTDRLSGSGLDYADRQTIRLEIRAVADRWDEFCARARAVSQMLHAISDDAPEPDPAIRALWSHAAHFAPAASFLRLMDDLRFIEPALYP